MKRLFKSQKGFTLIELLIVISILGALAAVAVPTVSSFLNTANITAANTEVANVRTASMSYLADTGNFPVDSSSLTVPIYISSVLKARYYFNSSDNAVWGVDLVINGWDATKLVFDVSEQKWVKGTNIDPPSGNQDRP